MRSIDKRTLTTVLYDWMPDGADVSVGFDGQSAHLTGSDLAAFIFDRAREYDLVAVRDGSGGVFPDGTTNHPPIDFGSQIHPYTCGTCPAEFGSRTEYLTHCVEERHDNWQAGLT